MTSRRAVSAAFLAASIAVGIGVYALINDAEPTQASEALAPAPQNAPITDDVRNAVKTAAAIPESPLGSNAVNEIRHLFTPADPDLPALFTVPTSDGRTCIVTSDQVVGSCLRGSGPGTITVTDESEGDKEPPFIYGLIAPDVSAVTVSVGGSELEAAIGNGFYLVKLPDSSLTVDAVKRVTFILADGATVTRKVNDE